MLSSTEVQLVTMDITALVLNSLLLPIILFRSPKEIGSYKYLLFGYTVINNVYASISAITIPNYYFGEAGWLMVTRTNVLPQRLLSFLICVWCGQYLSLIVILTYSYFYRFCVLSSPELLIWFHEKKRLLILTLFLTAAAAEHCLFCFFTFSLTPSETMFRIFGDVVQENFTTNGFLGAELYMKEYGSFSRAVLSVFVKMGIYSVLCTSIITYFIYKTISSITKLSEMAMSPSLKRLQRSFFTLLVIQTLVPTLFTITPGCLTYLFATLGFYSPLFCEGIAYLLSLSPVIDPIIIVIFVAEYRAVFTSCCFKKRISSMELSTSQFI